MIAAIDKQVEKKLAEKTASQNESKKDDAANKAYIMSLFTTDEKESNAGSSAKSVTIGATTVGPSNPPPDEKPILIPIVPSERLTRILNRVKNTKK